MDTTQLRRGAGRQTARLRRHGRILLAVVGLTAALLASACDTAQQVPWASYSSQLQPRIDTARVSGNCAVLQTLLTDAKTTSRAHEKATGFPNDALVSYIQAAQHQAGCPAGSG
jgi:D-serine deaminase-like pyridoxal phosphate-dependent protein